MTEISESTPVRTQDEGKHNVSDHHHVLKHKKNKKRHKKLKRRRRRRSSSSSSNSDDEKDYNLDKTIRHRYLPGNPFAFPPSSYPPYNIYNSNAHQPNMQVPRFFPGAYIPYTANPLNNMYLPPNQVNKLPTCHDYENTVDLHGNSRSIFTRSQEETTMPKTALVSPTTRSQDISIPFTNTAASNTSKIGFIPDNWSGLNTLVNVANDIIPVDETEETD